MKKILLCCCLSLVLLLSVIFANPLMKNLTASLVRFWPAPHLSADFKNMEEMFSTYKPSLNERVETLEARYKQLNKQTQAVLSETDSALPTESPQDYSFSKNDVGGNKSSSALDLGTTVALPLAQGSTAITQYVTTNNSNNVDASLLNVLSQGTAGYLLSSNGSTKSPSWIPYPSYPEMDSSFDTLSVGFNNPLSVNNAGQVSLAYTGNSGYLSSTGGALYMNNTNNIGTGLGIYSDAGSNALGNMINIKVDNPNYSQAAFYMNYDGNSNAVEIMSNSNDSSANALAVTSNNILDSTLGIIGNELAKGTIKVSHYRPTGGTDSNASAISVDLKGVGTRAQGIYVDSTEAGGTLGNLLRLRNTSIDKFVVDYQGNVSLTGNITQGSYGTDSSLTKFGNVTGDQFFVGTNGAFRVQRSVSNSEAFRVQIAGDTQGRWRGNSDGSLQWGDGSSVQDITLKRGAAGMLWLTGGITLNNGNNPYNTVVKGVSDSNLLYIDASSNQIGVGTSSPKAPFHIDKNSLGNAAMIINQLGSGALFTASSSGSTVFTLDKSGNVRTIGSLCVKANINSACAGNTPGTIYANNTTVQSADLAENYISSQKLDPGDIVMPANDGNNQAVIKTSQEYQAQAIGIVSEKPGVTLNSEVQTDSLHQYLYPMALQGRVPIKVTTKNGTITAGDLLTTSSLPGIAMKSNRTGTIVAKALEGYNNTDSEAVGKIMAFVSISNSSADEKQTPQSHAKVGQVVLPTGTTEVEIKTELMKDSRLFIQPEDMPIATAVKKKTDDTFLVKIANPQAQDVLLNWWLVN